MVPDLRRIVKDCGGFNPSGRRGYNLLQRQCGVICSCKQFIQVVYIALVMLPVMETDGVGGNDRSFVPKRPI
jgi:hypothetical protein